MRRFLVSLGWVLLILAGLLALCGLLTWPPGGMMFALPFVFLIPGALLGAVGFGLLLIGRLLPRRAAGADTAEERSP